MGFEGQVSASKWLKRIGNRSLLVIEEEDGTLFIGSVRTRASKVNMCTYWKERDGWRAKDGLDQKWTVTNMAMAPSLLRRNGGLEDCATILRLSARKRWEYSLFFPFQMFKINYQESLSRRNYTTNSIFVEVFSPPSPPSKPHFLLLLSLCSPSYTHPQNPSD